MSEKEKKKDKDKTKDKIKKKDADGSRVLSRKGSKSKIEEAPSILPDDIASPTMIEQPKEKGCIHHQLKLTSFCESCEEPICEQCSVYGPHNNQLHRINNLGEAYKSRVMAMHHVISGSLVNKRDQLIAQLHRIDHRLEEIKHVKTVIERDVRAEFGGILERLRSAEGVKLAVLQHEIAGLQRDVDKINDIVNVVNELTTEKADPIDFLLRCRHLTDTIEFTVAKPFKTQIEVAPYDLPRELGDQREKIEKMNVIKDILEMKDKVIFDLIKKYNDEEKRLIAEMNKAAQEEISEWSKLTDKFSGELKRYHLVCYYCGRGMDEKSVNHSCDTNNRTQIPAGFGFTDNAPERTWHGTRRHFFGKPKPELVKGGTISDINFPEFDFSGKNSKDEKSFKNQYYMFLEVLLAKVRKYCYEKHIEVDKLFTDHDKENKGFMNHVVFTFLLHQYCGVDQIEINKLQTILDPEKKDQIPYGELLKMIHDPKYLIQFQEARQAKK